jgi:hypothetical protein
MNTNRANVEVAKYPNPTGAPTHAALLWALTLLFAARVLGQAIQHWWPQTYLPAFGAFQGSGLEYPVLLSAQVIILALMVWAASRVGAGTLSPSRVQLRFLTGFGGLYMAGSVLRIVIGLAVPVAPYWFKAWIPAFFHLVLAGFVITVASYARQHLADSAKRPGANQ